MTLAELEAQRAAIPDDDALPGIQQRRRDLDRRLRQARDATATLAELHEPDVTWEERLHAWREVLCDELLAMPPRIRDAHLLGLQRNLTLSIRCIDFVPSLLKDTLYDVSTLRLGELMREAGYEAQGADPDRNYAGTMPWAGSLRDIEHRTKDVTKRREAAQSALDDALLDDDERAKREAESKARIAALNALPQRKTRGDGSQYDKYPDGRRVEVTT
jgi:hypothetical protein